MNFITLKTNKGFTLIETLVALSIFSTSIVVLVYLTSSGVANTNTAKNKFIASYLAQEGVEMVRNKRDTNSLNLSNTWNQFLTSIPPCLATATGCTIEPKTLSLGPACSPTCPNLNYDSSNGFYTYSGGTASNFKRKIIVDDLGGSDHEVKVTAIVSWLQGSITRSVSYSENLFDWIR